VENELYLFVGHSGRSLLNHLSPDGKAMNLWINAVSIMPLGNLNKGSMRNIDKVFRDKAEDSIGGLNLLDDAQKAKLDAAFARARLTEPLPIDEELALSTHLTSRQAEEIKKLDERCRGGPWDYRSDSWEGPDAEEIERIQALPHALERK
ncbi:hypothetical protein JCM10212_002147, partial [Sporobolomyces blumeae]